MAYSFSRWNEEDDPYQKEKKDRKLTFVLSQHFEQLKSRFSTLRSAALKKLLLLLRSLSTCKGDLEVFKVVQSRKPSNIVHNVILYSLPAKSSPPESVSSPEEMILACEVLIGCWLLHPDSKQQDFLRICSPLLFPSLEVKKNCIEALTVLLLDNTATQSLVSNQGLAFVKEILLDPEQEKTLRCLELLYFICHENEDTQQCIDDLFSQPDWTHLLFDMSGNEVNPESLEYILNHVK